MSLRHQMIISVSALCLFAAPAVAQDVTVAGGRLAGTTSDGITVYKGIRYAAPAAGPLRWRPPAAAPAWQGVKRADAFSPICPQPNMPWGPPATQPQSEDCLSLNIWAPAKPAAAKLPVMVWIHGGAYVAGTAAAPIYDGTEFAKKGVVLVTLNYRLGALGFLAHPGLTAESPDHSSGNYGLLDQIAALKWVKANIARFGGDPANVTIFGESAGGGSVMLLTISPQARGLFQKAISESGAALPAQPKGYARADAVITLAQGEAAGSKVAAALGAKTVAELRSLSVAAVLKVDAQGATWPIADGKVVPGDVTAVYRAGRQADVPVLLGWNSAEGVLFTRPQSKLEFEAGIRAGYGPLADRVLALYPVADDAGVMPTAAMLMSDITFAWPSWSLAEAQGKTGKAPVYLYQFDQPPPRAAGFPFTAPGAYHADEMAYVFGTYDRGAPGWPAADRRVADLMQSYWVNFARSGDPNGAGLPAWQPYAHGHSAIWFQNGGAHQAPAPRIEQLRKLDDVIGG